MKVAYFAEYRNGTYAAEIPVDNILALETAGVNVVCRPVSLSASISRSSCPVEHLENKSLNDVDAIIQHVTPNLYEHKKGVKNIGFLNWNQSTFNRSNWAKCCNLMDEIWVTCSDTKEAAQKSGVKKPIKIVYHGRDSKRFAEKFDPLDLPELDDKCIFYTIAELTRRQNITGLIRSYYAAFNKHDNVCLLLKLYSSDQDKNQLMVAIKRIIDDLKQATHIYPRKEDYPPIFLLCDPLDEKQIMQLHNTGHFFVSCDRGESWNIFLHDAIGFGRSPIYSNVCSQKELAYKIGWPVWGQETPCINISEKNNELNTGQDFWFDPDLKQFSKQLQIAFQKWQNRKKSMHDADHVMCHTKAVRHNYAKMGLLMKQKLQGEL